MARDSNGPISEQARELALVRRLPIGIVPQSNAIIVVFVHGWRHIASRNDSNLEHFCELLQTVATQIGASTPVLGIFAAWRGLSLYGFGLDFATFYDRKLAAQRVAMGAPRELLEGLRRFRRKYNGKCGGPLLAIIGHSFGGLIVYTAIAQSLIESATVTEGDIVRGFADLVLLVNPAFEAVRYLPVYDLVSNRSFPPDQPPVFVSVTARNDWATGYAFPIGMLAGGARISEATRGKEERQALIRTMGHVDWMQTHRLELFGDKANLQSIPDRSNSGFWVVSASPKIIDGHDRIWKPEFRSWVEGLLMHQYARPGKDRVSHN